MNDRKTKIIAKIADNRSTVEYLKDLHNAGMDLVWLNTAHQDEDATVRVINETRQVSREIPISVDTKGPEIRTRDIEKPLEIKKGDHIIFTGDLSFIGQNIIHVSYPNFHKEVPVGESILYDDALIEFIVIEKMSNGIKCEVKSAGLIKNKKSLNVPNVHIKLPALSDKDKSFIHFCAKYDVDYIFHSFVRTVADIKEILAITKKYPNYKPKIIAKIENREGFGNVAEILKHCEGLMVARGDLGAEVKLEEVPYMQKKMVEEALAQGKITIVATQALESMIKNPRPTRAEITDIANAVLDGAGGMSMSGETAYGDYPVEATMTMARIMRYTELKRDELAHFTVKPKLVSKELKLAQSLVAKIDKAGVKAVFAAGADMATLKALAAWKPSAIIFAGCTDEAEVRELGIVYAVRGVLVNESTVANIASRMESSFKPEDKIMVIEKKGKEFTASVKPFKALVAAPKSAGKDKSKGKRKLVAA